MLADWSTSDGCQSLAGDTRVKRFGIEAGLVGLSRYPDSRTIFSIIGHIKKSGKLGTKQDYKGAWDPLEEQNLRVNIRQSQ